MNNKTIFSFDFSMAKPALCVYINGKILFYCFPMNLDSKSENKLSNCNVKVFNRNLSSIDKKKFTSNELVVEHIKRANELSEMIIKVISYLLNEYNITINEDVIISSEGLSFASKGDATLDLSGYKYVLLSKLYSKGFTNIKTYSPITIKSIAGCSKKGNYGKLPMISKIMEEKENIHSFIDCLKYNPEELKKKTAFVNCVDDLVDAYWCLKTTIEKENLNISL